MESSAPALNFSGSVMLPLQTCDTVYLRALPQPGLFHHPCSSTRGSRAVFMFEQCDWRNKNDLAVRTLLFNEKHFLFMKQQRLHLFSSLNIYIFVMIKSDLLPFTSVLSYKYGTRLDFIFTLFFLLVTNESHRNFLSEKFVPLDFDCKSLCHTHI